MNAREQTYPLEARKEDMGETIEDTMNAEGLTHARFPWIVIFRGRVLEAAITANNSKDSKEE